MPAPIEGNVFTKGRISSMTFVLGFDLTALTNRSGILINSTSGNNIAIANNAITVADNVSGTITILANLAEAGIYMAQFSANNATLKDYSPEYFFKVVAPVGAI